MNQPKLSDEMTLAPPAGTRDLLFPESLHRKELGAKIVGAFLSFGYELVTTPVYEHANVIERGLAMLDARDLVRFVEPESGEIAVLRPDITPQIARVVATRLKDKPPPYRLAYEGSVVRRRRGRARKQKQIAQAGVECIGVDGTQGDSEVIELALRAVKAAGVADIHLELGHVEFGAELLQTVPENAREKVSTALSQRDAHDLEKALVFAGIPASARKPFFSLIELGGTHDDFHAFARTMKTPRAKRALRSMEELVARISSLAIVTPPSFDFADLRGASYYTGVRFSLLAKGPGEPLATGGRYDNLLGAYGSPLSATGFALDVDNIEWALAAAGTEPRALSQKRVCVASDSISDAHRVANELRVRKISVTDLGKTSQTRARNYANAWNLDGFVNIAKGDLVAERMRVPALLVKQDSERAATLDALAAFLKDTSFERSTAKAHSKRAR